MKPIDDLDAVEAALEILCENGITVSSPRDGDLDDLEQERFNAVVDACRAYAARRTSPSQVAPQPQAGEPVEPFDDKWLGDGDSVHVPASPQPANPAQVTDAEERGRHIYRNRLGKKLDEWKLEHVPAAAIGAGGQAVAVKALDKRATIEKVVGLCNRIPGSTQWNAAEFMFDELVSNPINAALHTVTRTDVLREWFGGKRYARDYDYLDANFGKQADRVIAFLSTLSQPHPADERVVEALREARQLVDIATDWNLDEVEINGEMVKTHSLGSKFDTVIEALSAKEGR